MLEFKHPPIVSKDAISLISEHYCLIRPELAACLMPTCVCCTALYYRFWSMMTTDPLYLGLYIDENKRQSTTGSTSVCNFCTILNAIRYYTNCTPYTCRNSSFLKTAHRVTEQNANALQLAASANAAETAKHGHGKVGKSSSLHQLLPHWYIWYIVKFHLVSMP